MRGDRGGGMIAAVAATAVATAAQAFLARFEGLRDRLPGRARSPRRRGPSVPRRRPAQAARRSLEIHQPAPAGRGRISGAADQRRTAAGPARAAARARGAAPGVRRRPGSRSFRWCPMRSAFSRFATTPDFGRLARPETAAAGGAQHHAGARTAQCSSVPDGADGGTILLASLAADLHGRPVAFHPRHRDPSRRRGTADTDRDRGGAGRVSAQPGDRGAGRPPAPR